MRRSKSINFKEALATIPTVVSAADIGACIHADNVDARLYTPTIPLVCYAGTLVAHSVITLRA